MGTFAQAFVKHKEKENKERVEKWRDALRQVGKFEANIKFDNVLRTLTTF